MQPCFPSFVCTGTMTFIFLYSPLRLKEKLILPILQHAICSSPHSQAMIFFCRFHLYCGLSVSDFSPAFTSTKSISIKMVVTVFDICVHK